MGTLKVAEKSKGSFSTPLIGKLLLKIPFYGQPGFYIADGIGLG